MEYYIIFNNASKETDEIIVKLLNDFFRKRKIGGELSAEGDLFLITLADCDNDALNFFTELLEIIKKGLQNNINPPKYFELTLTYNNFMSITTKRYKLDSNTKYHTDLQC